MSLLEGIHKYLKKKALKDHEKKKQKLRKTSTTQMGIPEALMTIRGQRAALGKRAAKLKILQTKDSAKQQKK